jgi:hypothetical protein
MEVDKGRVEEREGEDGGIQLVYSCHLLLPSPLLSLHLPPSKHWVRVLNVY